MSEFTCEIVKIGKVSPHPNADTLSITHVYDYPVIFKTGELQEGDLAIYFPIDAILPNRPEFAFLWRERETPTEKERVIRAVKLRGIFSMGLLMPVRLFPEIKGGKEKDNVADLLCVKKWDPPLPLTLSGNDRKAPEWLPRYTDIENIRKYRHIFVDGEPIVITEKVHGTNFRAAYKEDDLWVGSHNLVKQNDNNIWSMIAKQYRLEEKLKTVPDMILFGEIYGGRIQGGFDYGLKNPQLILFDIYSIKDGRYLDWDDFVSLADQLDIDIASILYRGPYTSLEDILFLAEGQSIMPNTQHIREGFVAKPIHERWHYEVGRVILKVHGEGYLLGKGKKQERGH